MALRTPILTVRASIGMGIGLELASVRMPFPFPAPISVPCLRPRSTRNCGWAAARRPYKGPRVDIKFRRQFKWILSCLIMCHKVRLDQNAQFWTRKNIKIWPVPLTKNSGLAPGAASKILQRGRKVTAHCVIQRLQPKDLTHLAAV